MDLKKSLEVLVQVAMLVQSKGILSLEEAVVVKEAKDVAVATIKEIEEEKEIKKEVKNGSK